MSDNEDPSLKILDPVLDEVCRELDRLGLNVYVEIGF